MRPPHISTSGYSFVELIFALGIIATVGATAVPQTVSSVDAYRAAGAARYLSGRMQRARMEAVERSAEVALRFSDTGAGFAFATYLDGNRNGVLTHDIQRGVDPALGGPERLADNFPGVDFGVLPGLPSVDAGGTPPGSDPLKLGVSNILAFSPAGTSSSGSVYILGRRRNQFVIRIYGETGKTRVLKFNQSLNQWLPL
jgi:type II secretory pathway pseudopilin PulG